MVQVSRAFIIPLVALPLCVGAGCGGVDRNNAGVCTGDLDPDGEIYYLELFNFVQSRIRVFVDGRQVGSVGAYDADNHVPSFQDLGHLPQCSNAKIGFGGSDAISLSDLQFTPQAVEKYPDRCAVIIALVETEDYFPDDWIEYDMRMPGSYSGEVTEREECPNWKYHLRIDGFAATGTPTPTATITPTRRFNF